MSIRLILIDSNCEFKRAESSSESSSGEEDELEGENNSIRTKHPAPVWKVEKFQNAARQERKESRGLQHL